MYGVGELLAVVGLEHRQLGIGGADGDVVNRVQHALLIVRVEQIVKMVPATMARPFLRSSLATSSASIGR